MAPRRYTGGTPGPSRLGSKFQAAALTRMDLGFRLAGPRSPGAECCCRFGELWKQIRSFMVFFFERGGQFIRCESRPADGGSGYELAIVYPDGREDIERFEDPDELNRRQLELERSLTAGGWFGPHGRSI